jgi:hypothetical protein
MLTYISGITMIIDSDDESDNIDRIGLSRRTAGPNTPIRTTGTNLTEIWEDVQGDWLYIQDCFGQVEDQQFVAKLNKFTNHLADIFTHVVKYDNLPFGCASSIKAKWEPVKAGAAECIPTESFHKQLEKFSKLLDDFEKQEELFDTVTGV